MSDGHRTTPPEPSGSLAAARPQAPTEVSIMFCPKCGRDDRVGRPFTGKTHWHFGFKCDCAPIVIYYTRNDLV